MGQEAASKLVSSHVVEATLIWRRECVTMNLIRFRIVDMNTATRSAALRRRSVTGLQEPLLDNFDFGPSVERESAKSRSCKAKDGFGTQVYFGAAGEAKELESIGIQ